MSYDRTVKSLTIRLPDELAERLERESRDRGVSKSDLVRERLSHDAPLQPAERSLTDILAASWDAGISVRNRRFRSRQKRRIAAAVRAKKLPR
jgi:predicted transcriptional regulator